MSDDPALDEETEPRDVREEDEVGYVAPAVYPVADGAGGTKYETASGEPRTLDDWMAQNGMGPVGVEEVVDEDEEEVV
jgi:hypothetical protein